MRVFGVERGAVKCFSPYGLALLMLPLLFSPLAGAQLDVEQAYVRGLPPGQTVTAAFMTLHNRSAAPLRILSAETPAAERVEFHIHSHEDGMMKMRPVAELTVPANDSLELVPGRLHLMLLDLTGPLAAGDQVRFKFCGEGFSCVELTAPVVSVLDE